MKEGIMKNIKPLLVAGIMTTATLAPAAPVGETDAGTAAVHPILYAWPADAMRKVFQDEVPTPDRATSAGLVIEAARNEVVAGQCIIWCAEPIERIRCRVEPCTQGKSHSLPVPRVRFAGYVPVNNKTPPGNLLRPRPCLYPDPLFDSPPGPLPARTAQPIWLTFTIPAETPPGCYTGTVSVEAESKGAMHQATLPTRIQVYGASLPDQRTLYVSNWDWFDTPQVARFCGVDTLYTEPFWQLMAAVARNMAAHRQNVIFTPTTAWSWGSAEDPSAQDLITGEVGRDGKLAFDFTRFDRWVTIFRTNGVDGLIEGSPLAKRSRDKKDYQSVVWTVTDGQAVRRLVPSLDPAHEQYLAGFLPALESHLARQGWLSNYVQHVLDEPNGERRSTYVQVAAWVRQYAPRLKRLDATQTTDLAGSIDIWVPTWNRLTHAREFYQARQARGEEVWFYTMGRPLEYPPTAVRLWHWANYASGTTGYLHWGYNWWVRTRDPNAGKWTLSPGDEWIVYPQPGGVQDSIRHEAMLEGIQDYELLRQLSRRDPAAADAICARLIPPAALVHGADFNEHVEDLRAARRDLLKALSE
jgi:hypothetical protein